MGGPSPEVPELDFPFESGLTRPRRMTNYIPLQEEHVLFQVPGHDEVRSDDPDVEYDSGLTAPLPPLATL